MLVLVFVMLFLMLLGVTYRQMAMLLRAEAARTVQGDCSEGSTRALALALALLETGLPPAQPYVCGVTLATSRGPLPFTVIFTSGDGTTWRVSAAPSLPGEAAPSMPAVFGAATAGAASSINSTGTTDINP
jgi:hypothetical protein